jgi:hypothetical protein
MGTANTQIATYSNVANKRIHNGFSASYATTATKCVNKGILQHVEFLEAKDRASGYVTYASYGTGSGTSSRWSNNMGVAVNGGTISGMTYSCMPFVTDRYAYITCSSTFYQSSVNQQVTCASNGMTYNFDKVADLVSMALCVKTIDTTAGKPTVVSLVSSPIANTSPSSGYSGSYLADISAASYSWYAIAVEPNTGIILAVSPNTYGSDDIDSAITLNFIAQSSTTTIYIVNTGLSMTFYPSMSGTIRIYAGLNISMSVNIYQSNYDLDTKCVQYQDINHPSGKQFTVYYGVWNNKGSNAKLNNLYVQIKKTSESSWTTIGTAALPSSLNKSTTGSVTCTLPTSYDPKVQYDFRVTAGQTNSNQQWYYRWGSQSSLTASGYSWTYYGKVQTGVCTNADGLNTHSAYSTLRNYNYSSSNLSRGRSASQAALFCIE